MKSCLILAILVTGLSGIIAQILLLRELLISFLGNELSIGVILANWLILEALGCFLIGKKIDHVKNKILAFIGVVIIFSVSLPVSIYSARLLRQIFGISIAQMVGILPILISSFFILLPVSVCHGTLFTFGCKIYSMFANSDIASISKVYVYETIGTIVGGIIFTVILIPYFHSFQIGLGLTFINFLICLVLIASIQQTGKLQKIMGVIVVISFILSGYFTFGNVADKLHRFSVKSQWKGHNVVHYQNSIYGNICVIQSEGGEQYTFFFDGIPSITTPIPDIIYVEEFVHLGMLAHSNPEDVLILSGGAGGTINEILKHPSVKTIEYIELDPLMMKVLRRFPTPLTETELNDPRVEIKYIDGRLFLKKTTKKYDLILVGLHEPSTLQANRFFTKEFFHLTKNRLKSDGILVIGLPSSYVLLTEELKQLNACIINALKDVFPYVRVFPGEDKNLYLSSTSPEISLIKEKKIIQRSKERNLKLSVLIPKRLERRLHPKYQEWFSKTVERSTSKINKDFQPLGLFYSISHWNTILSPYLKGFFRWFESINLNFFLILFFIFIFTGLLLVKISKTTTDISIPICITTTGFAGMTFDLVLIFAFQSLYGYVFHWIGILVSIFMVGIASGAILMNRLLIQIKRYINFFIATEIMIICFSFILPLILLLFCPHNTHDPGIFFILQILFLILSFFSGLLIGGEFPLANKIYLKNQYQLGKTAGLLYASDLFGGWIGGIVSGIILLPVLGLFQTCIVVVMLKVSSLVILYVSARRYPLNL